MIGLQAISRVGVWLLVAAGVVWFLPGCEVMPDYAPVCLPAQVENWLFRWLGSIGLTFQLAYAVGWLWQKIKRRS